jgi:poly(A) polymerase
MIDSLAQVRLDALRLRSHVLRLFALLNSDGEELRIVGGAVRNALMNREIADIDCATTATPDVVVQRARAAHIKAVPTGFEHGTVTLVMDGAPYEITTLREDVETDGRRAVVRYGRDFAHDALRRDFTINALSLSYDGTVHDVVGGVEDAANGIVRFIGDAHQRITEDYLRILRFFRFSSDFAKGNFHEEGLRACVSLQAGMDTLSKERIHMESLKILSTKRVSECVERMLSSHIAHRIWGETLHPQRLARLLKHPMTKAYSPLWRLAALCLQTQQDVVTLRERLRLSNTQTHALEKAAEVCVEVHSQKNVFHINDIKRLAYLYGVEATAAMLIAHDEPEKPCLTNDARFFINVLMKGDVQIPTFPLKGSVLIAAGIPKGAQVSQTLKRLEQHWLETGLEGDKEMLLAILPSLTWLHSTS